MKTNETSGVWGMNLEPGPEPDFKYYGSKPLDIASSTNSLSAGDEIKGFQTKMVKDKYFDEYPDGDKIKRGVVKEKGKPKKKKYPNDKTSMIIKFKEFLNENHMDIGPGSGTMGFSQSSGGMPNSPGEVTSALFGQGEYVAGTVTNMVEDPYFASVERKTPPKRSKRKARTYKNRENKLDRIIRFKEYFKK